MQMDEGCNHNEDMEDLMTLKLKKKKRRKRIKLRGTWLGNTLLQKKKFHKVLRTKFALGIPIVRVKSIAWGHQQFSVQKQWNALVLAEGENISFAFVYVKTSAVKFRNKEIQ